MISVAAMVNTSWVCDPKWESYELEQSERLVSHARATKVVHNFAWNPLYNKVMHNFAWTPLYIMLIETSFIAKHLSVYKLFHRQTHQDCKC